MEKEKIEQAAIRMLPYSDEECADSNYVLGKNVGFKRGFTTGARWRINAAWHDGTASCEARRKALVLFKNGNAAVYKDLRDISFEQLWDEVDKFAYLADLLPDTRKEAEP